MVEGHYFIWQLAAFFTETVFVWRQVARSYSSWLWVGGPHISIHCIAVNIGLYLPCVKRVLVHRHASHLTKTWGFKFLQQCSRGVHSYGIWCRGNGWLVPNILRPLCGFILKSRSIQMLYWNTGHQWHSDVPHPRKIETSNMFIAVRSFICLASQWEVTNNKCRVQ